MENYKAAAAAEEIAEVRREENKKVRQAEALEEKPNPLEAYLTMLAEAPGEDAWKDGLLGMGTGPDIPKLFRCSGRVRAPVSPGKIFLMVAQLVHHTTEFLFWVADLRALKKRKRPAKAVIM